jgi:asparagine N-glycosylation enzyme membrane subunit Stt3
LDLGVYLRGKWFFVLALAAVLVVAAALGSMLILRSQLKGSENVGGKYQSRIEITEKDPRGFDVGKIFYVKDGTEHSGYWGANMRNALEWIKNSTPANAVFLNWWDYGHMIVGYAERESVSRNPSSEALISVGDPSDFHELDPHSTIVDVAKALTTTNENETLATMIKHNATHIVVAADDGKGKAGWLFRFAELNYSDYFNYSWQPTDLPFDANQYNELGKQTVFCRILTHAQIPGLTQVYSDENFTICRQPT